MTNPHDTNLVQAPTLQINAAEALQLQFNEATAGKDQYTACAKRHVPKLSGLAPSLREQRPQLIRGRLQRSCER